MELKAVFDFLKKGNIKYYVVQIDPLKRSKPEFKGEFDLVVQNENEFNRFATFLKEKGWEEEQYFKFKGLKRIQLIKRDIINEVFFKLDIINDFFYQKKDKIFLIKNDSEISSEIIEDINYLKGDCLFYLYGIKVLHENKFDKLKFLNQIKLDDDFSNLEMTREKKLANTIVTKLIESNKIKVFKQEFILKNLKNSFLRYFFLKNISKIAFIGIDGAGKSTTIEVIKEVLNNQCFSCNDVYLGHKQYELGLIRDIGSKRKKSFFDNLLYVFLWPIEVRYRILKKTKISNVLLYDRLPDFEPVIPERKSYRIINCFFNFFSRILSPRPDVIFYLTGDEKKLWERKKESSFKSYKKRKGDLERMIRNYNKKVHFIYTDKTPEETINEIKIKLIENIRNIN